MNMPVPSDSRQSTAHVHESGAGGVHRAPHPSCHPEAPMSPRDTTDDEHRSFSRERHRTCPHLPRHERRIFLSIGAADRSLHSKVSPVGVRGFNQSAFSQSSPAFQLLFACQCFTHIRGFLIVDERFVQYVADKPAICPDLYSRTRHRKSFVTPM